MNKTVLCALALALALALPAGADSLSEGISLYQQGKYEQAEAQLRQARGAEASAYLAAALVGQRRYADAEGPARDALAESAGHPVAARALGEALVSQRKYDEAIDRLSQVIRARADVAYAYYWRAQAYYNKKQPDRMVGDFETFLKLAPGAPEAQTVKQILAGLR